MMILFDHRCTCEALYASSKPTNSTQSQTDPNQWPELDDEYLPVFPVQYFPEPYGDFVSQAADAIHAPVDFSAATLLGTVSSALTARVFVHIKTAYQKPLQLYIGIVGSSGSGKSPVTNIMINPLHDWLHKERSAIRAQNQFCIAEGRDPLPEPEAIMDDVTPESLLSTIDRQGSRGIVYAEEGNMINIMSGATYGGKGSQANLDIFLKGFDGAAVYCDRVSRDKPIEIRHAHLSMTIALQPRLLESFAKDPSLCDRDLPERMLFFIGRNLQRLRRA